MNANHTAIPEVFKKTLYCPLMIPERSLRTSRHWYFPVSRLRTRREAIDELRRPCGRFKSLLSTEEMLRLFVTQKIDGINDPESALVISDGMPLNWKRLLVFLHERGVTSAQEFTKRWHRNDYPHIFHGFNLASPWDPEVSDGRKIATFGFGGSFDVESAMSKAVGETLERYFLSSYKRDALVEASYANLSRRNRVLDIRDLDFFLDWQKKIFPALGFDGNDTFRWVKGREFLSGKAVYLPAQIVYWSYDHTPPDAAAEKVIFSQTTSGSAGHFTRDEALLAALLEALQRDAFLIYWLNSLTPKIIDVSTVGNPAITDSIDHMRNHNLEVVFLNTTSDFGIPTATCVIVDTADPQRPVFGVGSSAGFTLEETLIPSAIEAFSVQHFVSLQEPYILPDDYKPFVSKTIARFERLRAWQGLKMAERFRFFISGEKQSAQEFIGNAKILDTVAKRLTYIVNECVARGKGYEIYTFEVKNKVLDALGYHVVRAIVPELIPLYLTEFAAPLKARRLKEVPEKIGYSAAKEFNAWPHPFP